MSKIWELDFYSRPIIDENNKKLWEVLICESLSDVKQSTATSFRYSQFTSNQSVNSLWLKEAIEEAISQAGEAPKKIRFFRRQMNNMIAKACEDANILAAPSRRTYTLKRWLEERSLNVYPQQAGYDEKLAQVSSVQYPDIKALPLPDALRTEKNDKWSFVSLDVESLEEMNEWEIGFREAFPLSLVGVDPQVSIPGLLIFSSRALPLAAWLSGLELAWLKLEESVSPPRLRLETGDTDSWILLNFPDKATLAEVVAFEQKKKAAKGMHFLAIQSRPDVEAFTGFWLLWDNLTL